ncbi:MAG: lipid asymmetry maintenance protein MlaB [Spirochaetaceae bacterium]
MAQRNTGEPRTLSLSGPLTFQTVGKNRDTLLEALETPGEIVLDLSGLESIDLAGAQMLVSAHKSLEAAGGTLRVRNAERYRRICDFAGIRMPGVVE